MIVLRAIFGTALVLALLGNVRAADTDKGDEIRQPHTPTLVFYLSGADGLKDADALRASIEKLPGASVREVNTNRSYVRVRFDSHVVSYHQVAQAIANAGTALGKRYQPFAIFIVNDYARTNNAAAVDAIFAGKRLNTRVHVTPFDKAKGKFLVHFLPLKLDPSATAPQGFNGGHLHHPVSDPPRRGLGLFSDYASDDDPSVPLDRIDLNY
jgi:copper chaperone CopZ